MRICPRTHNLLTNWMLTQRNNGSCIFCFKYFACMLSTILQFKVSICFILTAILPKISIFILCNSYVDRIQTYVHRMQTYPQVRLSGMKPCDNIQVDIRCLFDTLSNISYCETNIKSIWGAYTKNSKKYKPWDRTLGNRCNDYQVLQATFTVGNQNKGLNEQRN